MCGVAASEGNFSAAELVRRLREVQLDEVVSHRKLILPQLSAPGVNAFEVTRLSGFHVVYGPVYARDIPRFLAAGNTASPEMRRIHFRWHERLAVAPLELVIHFRRVLLTGVALAFLSGVTSSGFSLAQTWTRGGPILLLWMTLYVLAGFLGPLLLPWLPARAFAIKGAWLGAALAAFSMLMIPSGWPFLRLVAWLILVVAGASFLLLNFTGSTTFTSPSGVRCEVRVALPAQSDLRHGRWQDGNPYEIPVGSDQPSTRHGYVAPAAAYAKRCARTACFLSRREKLGCAEAIINGLLTGKETCCDGSETGPGFCGRIERGGCGAGSGCGPSSAGCGPRR